MVYLGPKHNPLLPPSTQRTIGCCGRARHGKDTVAALIKTWHHANHRKCQVIAFADPIKEFLTSMVGRVEPFRGNNDERTAPLPELLWRDMTSNILRGALLSWGPKLVRSRPFLAILPKAALVTLVEHNLGVHPNGRQLMQLLGTEVIRQQLIDGAWIMIAGNKAARFPGTTVVSDVRFPNEALRKNQKGGIFDDVYKIVRPGQPVINHPSEWSVDLIGPQQFTAIIHNDAGLPELKRLVYGEMRSLHQIGESAHLDHDLFASDHKDDA